MTGSANMRGIAALPIFLSFKTHTLLMKSLPPFKTSVFYKLLLPATLVLLLAGQQTTLAANPASGIRIDSFPVKMPCYRQFEKEMIRTARSAAANATDIQSGVVNYVARVAQLNRRFYICLDKQYTHAKN